MKKLMTFLILLLVCGSMTAQNVEYTETQETLKEQIDFALENLDFSEVTSGYLLENTVPLYPLNRFSGYETTDSTLVSIADLNLMYNMMTEATTTNSTLPPYSNIENAAAGIAKTDPIPIVIFRHRYHRMKSNVITDNLLSVSNGQLFDVPNRPESPYQENVLFVAATMLPISDTLNLSFKLETDFIINNLGSPLTEVLVDFNDGNGFQNMSIGDIVNVSYDDYTERVVTIKEVGANPRTSQTKINLIDPINFNKNYELTPDETITFDIDNDGKDEAEINIFFASCPSSPVKRIRKPFIYIQGFNASRGFFNLDFPELFEKKFNVAFSDDGNITLKNLNQELSKECEINKLHN